MPVETALAIGIGAAGGAVLRYMVGIWMRERFGAAFPYGTLLINVTGSFVLALFLAWATRQAGLPPVWHSLIAVGFCGGYTTYSSFANEAIALIQRAQWLPAALYIGATNGLCLLSVLPGLWLGSKL